MFQIQTPKSRSRTLLGMAELIYHSAIRDIRKNHRNPLMGLVMNIFQSVLMIASFYAMFALLGIRGAAVRGDYLMYIMSGIFLYMAHTKAMSSVVASEGPASPMMQHAPMSTAISICAAALSSLYLQFLSIFVILFIYHVTYAPVVIENPIGALEMFMISWFSGVAVGTIFLAIKPWSPEFTRIGSSIYGRVNMIASGKMFLANTLPPSMLVVFDWNPLFHTIDQLRGDIFVNYNPHFSSATYPVYVALVLLMLGLLGEYYTRGRASASWNAGR
ncbi:ABC-type polysaccharide/polyol phosphate export permease [Loktanella fryxellensis]|uniref:ABC-type polysaccharide/polyol phosphate export permease n=1 Tax=Loktanella fryxellensis TaxID=245187 RepID=A0A1H8DSP1_9RHOB|nr:ABC transporter permease [Loktanella fryxellensis]SEN09864.1 ABC-type polysaccharide/polyol phosphate export permease [Loktanella fryxellensis]